MPSEKRRACLPGMFAKVKSVLTSSAPAPTVPAKEDTSATSDGAESSITAKRPTHGWPKQVVVVDQISPMPSLQTSEQRADAAHDKSVWDENVASWVSFNRSEWVQKPVRMRVRRICHECNTPFASKGECSNCRHVRCDKCPRSPPKKTDYTDALLAPVASVNTKAERAREPLMKRRSKTGGQDLVHRKPRQRVRRTCHECGCLFLKGIKDCEQCGHVRCTDCPRSPAKKEKYPYGYPGDSFGDESARFECISCETVYPSDVEDGTPCVSCGCEKSEACGRAVPREVQPAPDLEVLERLRATLQGRRA